MAPSLIFLLVPVPFAGVLEAVPGFSRGTPLVLYYLGLRDELWERREPSDGIPEIKVQTILHTGI